MPAAVLPKDCRKMKGKTPVNAGGIKKGKKKEAWCVRCVGEIRKREIAGGPVESLLTSAKVDAQSAEGRLVRSVKVCKACGHLCSDWSD